MISSVSRSPENTQVVCFCRHCGDIDVLLCEEQLAAWSASHRCASVLGADDERDIGGWILAERRE
jgi:hypothetical protein